MNTDAALLAFATEALRRLCPHLRPCRDGEEALARGCRLHICGGCVLHAMLIERGLDTK